VGHKNGTKTEDTPLILKDSKLSDSAAVMLAYCNDLINFAEVCLVYTWCVTQFQLEDAVKQKMVLNMKLEQDSMEGVDESEWVSH